MKVYLSKSKQANPDLVLSVKKALKEYVSDVEILEFTGGQYDPQLKFKANMVICIPPGHISSKRNIHVGRGNYGEVTETMDKNIHTVVIAISKDEDPLDWKKLKVISSPICSLSEEQNWQINWGTFSGETQPLETIFRTPSNVIPNDNKINDDDLLF